MRVDAKIVRTSVRQAIALSLDRKAIVQDALSTTSPDVGNDSNFAPLYPSTDKERSAAAQGHPRAKKLMAQAGHPKGFKLTLTTERTGEIRSSSDHSALGGRRSVDMALNIETGDRLLRRHAGRTAARLGNTPWLNAPMNITDWGHRAVPNVVLTAAFRDEGHLERPRIYSNAKFDKA